MTSTLPHGLSVFLADDVAEDRVLFKEALMKVRKNIKVAMLNNGEQLMNCLDPKKTDQPSLIFLDLNMP